jgi:hypothetical protein
MSALGHIEIRILELNEEKERLSHQLAAVDKLLEYYRAESIAKSAIQMKSAPKKETTPKKEATPKPVEKKQEKAEELEVELEVPLEEPEKKPRRGRPPKKDKAKEESKYKAPASPHKMQNLSKKATEARVAKLVKEDEKGGTPAKVMRAEKRQVSEDPQDDGNDYLSNILGGVDEEILKEKAPEVKPSASAASVLDPKTKEDISSLVRELAISKPEIKSLLAKSIKEITGYTNFSKIPDDESVTTEIWYSISEWGKRQ